MTTTMRQSSVGMLNLTYLKSHRLQLSSNSMIIISPSGVGNVPYLQAALRHVTVSIAYCKELNEFYWQDSGNIYILSCSSGFKIC